MTKGIALSKIEYGSVDKDGKAFVQVFNAGDKLDLPEETMQPLFDGGAAAPLTGATRD